MRVAAIVLVLIIHVGFFILFALQRSPFRRSGPEQSPPITYFLAPDGVHNIAEGASQAPIAAQATPRTNPKRSAAMAGKSSGPIVRPEPQPPSNVISAPVAPDWSREMQMAANNEVDAEERKRDKPSLLAPHDFSRVRPGSTDYSKPQFGWNHAATHRVEELPGGGLLINVNDRCAIAWVIFPFPICRVGKIPVQGDLFQHMKDPAALGEPELP